MPNLVAMPEPQTLTHCHVLTDRSQYVPCHVTVPDLEGRLSAIAVGSNCYGFFRVEKTSFDALKLIMKLSQRGDNVAITRNPKGYGIWVEEPEFSINNVKVQAKIQAIARQSSIAPCKILVTDSQYQPIKVQVPDLDASLEAAQFANRYYSFFKQVPDSESALELVARITERGEESALIISPECFTVCVHEPEALPISA